MDLPISLNSNLNFDCTEFKFKLQFCLSKNHVITQGIGQMKKIMLALSIAMIVAVGAWFSRPYWQTKPQNQALTLYGNVDIRQISLAFEGSERVAEMRVYEGDKVKKGQVLAVLDAQSLRLQLAQAEAQAEALQSSLKALLKGNRPEEIRQADANSQAMRAEMERTEIVWKRLQKLANSDAISQQDLDNARSAFQSAKAQWEACQQAAQLMQKGARSEDIDQARAQLKASEAQVALLKYQLTQTELIAPQDAIVRARLLEVGDMASPSRPAYTLALTDPKWIRAYVNEVELGKVRQGMSAKVMTDSDPQSFINGKIGYISSVAEFTPKTVQTTDLRTDLVYEIRILVDDKQDRLRLGMPATVQIDLTQPAPLPQTQSENASEPATPASAPSDNHQVSS